MQPDDVDIWYFKRWSLLEQILKGCTISLQRYDDWKIWFFDKNFTHYDMKNNFRSYFTRFHPENSYLSFLKDAPISTVWLGLSPKHAMFRAKEKRFSLEYD